MQLRSPCTAIQGDGPSNLGQWQWLSLEYMSLTDKALGVNDSREQRLPATPSHLTLALLSIATP